MGSPDPIYLGSDLPKGDWRGIVHSTAPYLLSTLLEGSQNGLNLGSRVPGTQTTSIPSGMDGAIMPIMCIMRYVMPCGAKAHPRMYRYWHYANVQTCARMLPFHDMCMCRDT